MREVETDPDGSRLADGWKATRSSSFFQDPAYGELYRTTTRHRPVRLVVGDGGAVLAYAQAILFREGPAAMGSLAAHATVRHGPVMMEGATPEDWTSLLSGLARAFRSRAAYLRIYPGRIEAPGTPFAQAGFKRAAWLNFYVDLRESEEALLSRMTKERRYGIRKASERGVRVVQAGGADDVATSFGLLADTHERARFPLEPRAFFLEAFRRFHPHRLQVFLAKADGRSLATSVVAIDGDSAVNWYAGSGSKPAANKYYANDAVIWEAIRWARGHGLRWFDMGGGGPPGDPHGFVKFKRQFGGQVIDVGHFTHVPQPWKMTLASKGFDLLRRIRRMER